MKSLLHCLWTGPSFPYALRAFIKKWVKYLKNSHSDFEVVLWLTDDSLKAFNDYLQQGGVGKFDQSQRGKCFAGVDVEFCKASLNYQNFYVAMLEPLLPKYPDIITSLFRVFQENCRYTSLSNIGRIIALDCCGGLYSDIDFLLPNEQVHFPKDITSLMSPFNRLSRIDFFVDVKTIDGTNYVENQCLMLSPKRIGALTSLLRNMASKAGLEFDKIVMEAQNYSEFLTNERTEELNKSLFLRGHEADLASAFKQRDAREFDRVNSRIYARENFKTEVYNYDTGRYESGQSMLKTGSLHHIYNATGMLTYQLVIDFFEKNLTRRRVDYSLVTGYRVFHSIFDIRQLKSQYDFVDPITGGHIGMFSWANPGFSRLTKLEKATVKVENKLIEKSTMIQKSLLLELINKASSVPYGMLELSSSKNLRRQQIQWLQQKVRSLRRSYLAISYSECVLTELFEIALVRRGIGKKTNMGKFLVQELNTNSYSKIKKLIDPEKKSLSYEDLEGFMQCHNKLEHLEIDL
ncbi:hypothetical protein AAEX28_00425 [Lentisphaerota bacterium WC36G]|nr:hypothetical protein LJT99_03305 [Lentisphaerae bacterium WC36]